MNVCAEFTVYDGCGFDRTVLSRFPMGGVEDTIVEGQCSFGHFWAEVRVEERFIFGRELKKQ